MPNSKGGLLPDILTRSSNERINELERSLSELRTQIGEIVMPEIELRATLRLTPDEYWEWLFEELKKTPSSPEQLHWISFMTRLHRDLRRRSIAANIMIELFNFLQDEHTTRVDAMPDPEYKSAYEQAFKDTRNSFLKFVAQYPKLDEKFQEYKDGSSLQNQG